MGRGTTLTNKEIGQIQILKEAGCSSREIGRKLGRSHGVINNYLRDPENYGKQRMGGVKTATTERERRNLLIIAFNDSLTVREIANRAGTSASLRTVQRILKECPQIKRMKLERKPVLKKVHQGNRLVFCRKYMGWTTEWQKVIFTDEKRFCLDGPDGFSYYFHDLRKEKRFLSRRQNAFGSIMVWGAVSYNGVVDLVIIEGKQNAKKYKELLIQERIKITETMEHSNWIYQQDNASIHTAKIHQGLVFRRKY